MLSSLTGNTSIPDTSIFLASMATQYGGLGIQNPRATAIPSFVINVKRCLGYVNNGVWVGHNHPTVQLPQSISSIWSSPETSASKTLQLFYKYLPQIESICVSNQVPNRRDFFLNKSSINTCRERIKEAVGQNTRGYVKLAWQHFKQKSSLANFSDILHPNLAQGMLDMPRLNEKYHLENDVFSIMLKRKLRLPLYPGKGKLKCPKCKQNFDRFGDHLFRCKPCNKSQMHDGWRDGCEKIVCKEILPLVKLIKNENYTENEEEKLIPSLQNTNIKPFDLSFKVDKHIGEAYYKSPLQRIGFDVTMSQAAQDLSNEELSQSDLTSAQTNGIALQLLDCEVDKFNRDRGGTDKKTNVTLSGDEIIGELTNSHQALIPWSISPYGNFGDLSSRFWYGTNTIDLSSVINKRHAKSAAKLARSNKVPSGVLERADKLWQHKHPGDFFGRSYKSQTPTIYANQIFGYLTCLHNGQHIIRGMSTIGNPLPYMNENDMEIDNDTDMNALPTVGDSECVHDNATTLDSIRTHMPSA